MKKGLVLGLAGLFLLTGCGNKVKCSGKKVSLTMNAPKGTKMTKEEFKKQYCKK